MSHRLTQPEEVEIAFSTLQDENDPTDRFIDSDCDLKMGITKLEGCPSFLAYTPTTEHKRV